MGAYSEVSIDSLFSENLIDSFLEPGNAVYITRCFYQQQFQWTSVTVDSDVGFLVEPNSISSDGADKSVPIFGTSKNILLSNFSENRMQNDDCPSSFHTFFFNFQKFDCRFPREILTICNYNKNTTFENQIQKNDFPEKLMALIDNAKFIVGHREFLKELKKFIDERQTDGYGRFLDDQQKQALQSFFMSKIFVKSCEIGQIPRGVYCAEKNQDNHNNTYCTICVMDKMKKEILKKILEVNKNWWRKSNNTRTLN